VSGTAMVTSSGRDETIYNMGTLEITGGTVSATLGSIPAFAVLNTSGTVSITGGTVSSATGTAVFNQYSGAKLIVSGTAKLTSANTSTGGGTISLRGTIEMTGGTVENTSTTTGNAIYIGLENNYQVSITGGTVRKAGDGNYAVYKGGTGSVTIEPGATIVGNNYGF